MKKGLVKNNNGLSLFELLLVVGVMAFLLTGAVKVLDNWYKSTVDRDVAIEMTRLQNAAEKYVELNFADILAVSVPIVGNIAEIPVANLIADGFLPAAYNTMNSYRQTMRIFVRHVTDTAAYGSVIEVVTISDGRRVANERLHNAAVSGGPEVGIVNGLNAGQINSSSGSWTLNVADFPAANVAYNVAAYGRVKDERVLKDQYLFRVSDAAYPQANRMSTNIDMNNYDIVNADMAVVDSMAVTNDVTMTGLEPDGTRSPYVLSVRDNFTTNEMDVISDGDITKGNVYIDGDNGMGTDFTVNNILRVNVDGAPNSGNVSSESLTSDNIAIDNNAIFNTASMNTNNMTSDGNIYSRNMRLGTDLNTTEFQVTNTDGLNNVNTDRLVGRTLNVSGAGESSRIQTDAIIENNISLNGNTNANNAIGRSQTTISNMNCADSVACP